MKRSIAWTKKVAILLIWLAIWQVAHWYVGKDILVPSPFATFDAALTLLTKGTFYQHVFYTLYRVCMGILISLGLGILTGTLACFIKGFDAFLAPFIAVLKATPVMAVIMLALRWYNSHLVPIVVGVLMCYRIVHTQLLAGRRSLDKQMLEVGKIEKVKTY